MTKESFTAPQDRGAALERFARADDDDDSASLPVVIPQQAVNLFGDRAIGAQQVAVRRNELKILRQLAELGAAAGSDWFYRYPVKKKGGGTEYIEGPSIKLANDLARLYGNCDVDSVVIDMGDHWMIYSRFIDYETGHSRRRPWMQHKSASKLGGDDDDRRMGMSLQTGISKAERNIITKVLQTFADWAFQEARSSLVDEIGRDLDKWRRLAAEKLQAKYLPRAERLLGRPLKQWLAEDLARVRAMILAVEDGMADPDESFPPIESETQASGLEEFGKTDKPEEAKKAEPKEEPKPEPEPKPEEDKKAKSKGAKDKAAEDRPFGADEPEIVRAPANSEDEAAIISFFKAAPDLKKLTAEWETRVQAFASDIAKPMFKRLADAANARRKEFA